MSADQQQPPEGLSAENRAYLDEVKTGFAEGAAGWWRIHADLLNRLLNAARSTSPAPDPKAGGLTDEDRRLLEEARTRAATFVYAPAKAGEREQVAEAVEPTFGDAHMLLTAMEHSPYWADARSVGAHHTLRTVLSALAEARSEVEEAHRRRKEVQVEHDGLRRSERDWRTKLVSAQAERDTLAAQLVGAREALEPFARIGDSYVEGDYSFRIESTRSTPYSFGRLDVERARQALSMSILRGDKGEASGDQVARPQTEAGEPVKPSEEQRGMELAMGGPFCDACLAFPKHGYCNLAGCPMPRPVSAAQPSEGRE